MSLQYTRPNDPSLPAHRNQVRQRVTALGVVFPLEMSCPMILWLVRVARPYGFSRLGIRLAARALARLALVMTIIYVTTLAITMGGSLLVRGM